MPLAGRTDDSSVLDPPVRRWPGEVATGAVPFVAGAFDVRSALGADPGVVVPTLTGGDPRDVFGVARGPDHHRVVRVGDDLAGPAAQGVAPERGHHRHLFGAVELV